MKVQMPADVFIGEAGTKEKRGRVDRTAGANDSLTANVDAVTAFRKRFDAGCGTSFDSNAKRAGFKDEARTILVRIGEPRFCGRLFRTESAAITAVAANFSLVAANDVAWHRVHLPAKSAQAAVQNLFPA
jgi:hypothetical protein